MDTYKEITTMTLFPDMTLGPHPDRVTLELNPAWVSLIKWVSSATSKDEARPALQAFRVQEHCIDATDGFVVHRVIFRDDRQQILPVGYYRLLQQVRTLMVLEKFSLDQYKFPDVDAIWPKAIAAKPTGNSDYYSAVLCVNPYYLSRAMKASKERYGVTIEFGAGPIIVDIPADDTDFESCGVDLVQALVMPMHSEAMERKTGVHSGVAIIPKDPPHKELKNE